MALDTPVSQREAATAPVEVRQSVWRVTVRYGAPIAGALAFVVALSFVEDEYKARVAALIAFWTAVCMAWNLLAGYAGQVLLGNAAFVGLGAYTSVLLLIHHNITPWIGFAAAAAVSGVAALLVGLPTLRLTGLYFSLATLAYPLVLQPLATWSIGREVLIPARSDELFALQFRDLRWYAVILMVIVVVLWYMTIAIERSRWYLQLRALRQDEAVARSAGTDAYRLKLAMFVISAMFSGIAGVVYAQLLFVVTPTTVFGLTIVIQTLVITLLGGFGRKAGPLLGAVLIVPLVEYLDSNLSNVAGASDLAFGLILGFVIIVIPSGILGSRIVRRLGGYDRVATPLTRAEVRRASQSDAGMLIGPATPSSRDVVLAGSASHRRDGESGRVILRAGSMTKTYGAVVAVQDVDLVVTSGEFVGVVGPNGAGKTTLFDLITGYQQPTDGRVYLQGVDITSWAPERRARLGIRRTFQIPRPLTDLTVFENTLLGATHPTEGQQSGTRELAVRALSTVGMLDEADTPAGNLFPSQIRLMELARALAGRPAVLLLDEPFAGLDPRERTGFVDVLKRCWSQGMTIVLVDHDIRTVAANVERLFVLDNGVEIAQGGGAEVVRDRRVIDAYLGSKWHHAEA